jgi:hypothetical protein
MIGDGEPMSFITDSVEEMKKGGMPSQSKRFFVLRMKNLLFTFQR